MPKLLQINVTVNTGSTGRIAEEIGQRAMAAGYESYIAYGKRARKSQSKVIKIGTKWDYRWHGLISMLFDAHGFGSKRATKKFVKQLEEINPDIVLLHNVHGYYLNIDILLSYLSGKDIPIFWTLHDCWPFTGHCAHYMKYNCMKWESHCDNCPNRKGYPMSLFLDRSYKNYEKKRNLILGLRHVTFVPVCKWMRDVVSSSFAKNKDAEIIYNGIDTSVFTPAHNQDMIEIKKKYHISDKKVVLGVANTWKKKQALVDFLWLSEHLPEDYTIVLVGMTESQIKALPIGVLGITRTEDVKELAVLYSLADVFVNPTYGDTFPTTNIESLACGTPVITYNTGGSPEAVDESTGIVVPKGDKEVLKDAIIDVVNNKMKYSSEACRKRAEDHFNKDDRFGDYIELFNKSLCHE